MKNETRKLVAAFATSAIMDPQEREEVLEALRPKKAADELLTSRKAAELLGVSVRTLQAYEKQGKITARRISCRKIRWSRNELLAMWERRSA